MMKSVPSLIHSDFFKRARFPLALLLATLCLYGTFRSCSLDDFDAYSFILALDDFNLTLQQPQPPGFPVYIALARALRALTGNALSALTWLSAISGAAATLLVYALANQRISGSADQRVSESATQQLSPQPSALSPQPSVLSPQSSVLSPQPSVLSPQSSALSPQSSVLSPQSSVLTPHTSSLTPHSSLLTPHSSLLSTLLFALLPMAWLTADKALSDMPGLALTLLALALLLAADARPAWLAAGGLATGLALGVRPQNALPLAMLGLFWLWEAARSQRSFKTLLIAGGCAGVGVLLWLWPTARAAGGLAEYVGFIRAHASHVGQADSLAGMGLSLGAALRARALAFGDTFLSYTLGMGTFAPWGLGEWLRVLSGGAFAVVGLARADWRQRRTWSLALWTLAAAAQVFLVENLDRPRLMLPILPPLVLLIAQGWERIRRPRWLTPAVTAAASLALLMQGAPLAATLATIPAPPAQAAAYVADHYPPETTLIAAAGSFRAAQVELPAYRLAYLYEFNPQVAADAFATGARYVVIFDRDQFPAEAVEVLSDGGRLVALEERTFTRSRRVHTQHDQVRVQVLTPAELIPPEALALPETGCVDIGGDDGRYLGTGWFRPEDIGGVPGRWAGETVTATLRLLLPSASAYTVRLRALAFSPGQTVALNADGETTAAVALPQSWNEIEIALPGRDASDVTTLSLVHAIAQSAFDASGGASSDTRPLTAAYDWVCVIMH
ncbi:MAG TPA: hypothetical protein PKH77_01150 [Anaerolineae bacterium]|nr:hypothetical protein [Anaerolineae bacterium]